MSYILEALRKLEQKRELEEPAKPPSFSRGARAEQKRLPIWPYPVLAALLINAGVIIWWIGPWGKDGQKIPTPPVVEPVAASTAKTQVPALPVAPAEVGNREQIRSSDTKEAPQTKTTSNPPAQAVEKQPLGGPMPTAGRVAKANKPATEPQPGRDKGVGPNDPAYTVKELPAFIRNGLPEFKISGHAYSPEPQKRVARVNEKVLQEGQDLAPGLTVEEIIPDGIVFTYQGYRFRVPVSHNR